MTYARALTAVAVLLLPIASDSTSAVSRGSGRIHHAQAQQEPNDAKPEPPRVPRRTEILNFDDWTVTCVEYSEGPSRHDCSATLRLTQKGTNNVVLAWTVGLNEQNKAVTVFQTLTGVAIKPGLELHLGRAAVRKIPYESCFPKHCVASTPIDGAFVRNVSAASTADVVITAATGKTLKFNFPIKGFAKAYAALRR